MRPLFSLLPLLLRGGNPRGARGKRRTGPEPSSGEAGVDGIRLFSAEADEKKEALRRLSQSFCCRCIIYAVRRDASWEVWARLRTDVPRKVWGLLPPDGPWEVAVRRVFPAPWRADAGRRLSGASWAVWGRPVFRERRREVCRAVVRPEDVCPEAAVCARAGAEGREAAVCAEDAR